MGFPPFVRKNIEMLGECLSCMKQTLNIGQQKISSFHIVYVYNQSDPFIYRINAGHHNESNSSLMIFPIVFYSML